MNINTVWGVYFTGTLTTKLVVQAIALGAAAALEAKLADYDFSLPAAREHFPPFGDGDLVILGTPTYAGRVPNLLLKSLGGLKGPGALGVPVVLFGNRAYDDSLIELRDILQDAGMATIGAGAFVGEHSFSTLLGRGRPNTDDIDFIETFAERLAHKVARLKKPPPAPISVPGVPKPYGGYYQPQDRRGNPIDLRKVKPITGWACVDCKLCVDICPMAAIDPDKVSNVPGVCIKCCACVKRCPRKAKDFSDPLFLLHRSILEDDYYRHAESEVFL
jgi:ferredoxin